MPPCPPCYSRKIYGSGPRFMSQEEGSDSEPELVVQARGHWEKSLGVRKGGGMQTRGGGFEPQADGVGPKKQVFATAEGDQVSCTPTYVCLAQAVLVR